VAATYYYLVADLRTNAIYGEIPIEGASFDRILNGAGNFNGATHMDNRMLDNDALIDYTEPGKTALYIYREDTIVWGGILWARWYQSQGKSLQFSAQTFESYAYRRVRRPLVPDVYNEGQCLIISDLWDKMQTLNPYSDIGVNLETSFPGSDVVRTLTLNPWDLRTYGETIEEITGYDNGCDYTIQVTEVSGVPTKNLDLWYPGLGSTSVTTTNNVLDYPGNIKNYYYTENASEGNTKYFVAGDGDGKGKIVGVQEDTTKMSVDGYPRLDKVVDGNGVTLQATADRKAAAALMNGPVPQEKWQFDISGQEIPVFGSYMIGDTFQVNLEDPRFPSGRQATIRVVGWSVNPTSSSNVEDLSLVLEEQVNV
jgi:hypothetical protein